MSGSPDIRSIAEMSHRTKVIVMAGTLLGMFTAAMDQTIVATSLPRIVANLGGLGLFPWVFTAFMVTSTITVPIVGKLADLYGRKPFFIAGIAILLLGSALSGSSQSMEALIAFRAVQGLGAGMIFGIAFAIVGDVFPPAERGKWNGLLSGVFAMASVAGPLIGGYLTDEVHWRWVFYVNLPLGGVALAILALGMPALKAVRANASLDYRGVVLLVAAVVPMLLALSWAGSRYDWLSTPIIGLLSAAAAFAVIFVYSQRLAPEPLMPLRLFRNPIFSVSVAVVFLTGMGMFGAIAFVPLFVQGVTGASAANSGLITMPMMISVAVASGVAGQIISRLGRYRLLGVVGLSIMVVGMFLFSQMDADTSRLAVTRNMVIFGIGLGTSLPLFLLVVQNSVGFSFMGIATSSIQFFRSVGGTMGVAIMGSLINSALASELVKQTPVRVQDVPPEIREPLTDPQILLSPQALEGARQGFLGLDQGQQLFEEAVEGLRSALATSIADAFLVAMFAVAAALAVAVFLKEIPLRRTQFEPLSRGSPAAADGSVAHGPVASAEEPLRAED